MRQPQSSDGRSRREQRTASHSAVVLRASRQARSRRARSRDSRGARHSSSAFLPRLRSDRVVRWTTISASRSRSDAVSCCGAWGSLDKISRCTYIRPASQRRLAPPQRGDGTVSSRRRQLEWPEGKSNGSMTPKDTASLSRKVAKTSSCTFPRSRWRDSRLYRKDKRSSSRFAPEKKGCTPRTWCESDTQPDSRPFDAVYACRLRQALTF